jgi:polygalacturonase
MKHPIFALFVALSLLACKQKDNYPYAYLYEGLEFEMPRVEVPSFPNREVSIEDFGAVGDGLTLNTEAFNEAFKSLSSKGGGSLIVPSGVWLTGPIVFQSNVRLHLEKAALILFTQDKSAYPVIKTSYEGLEAWRCQSPISGRNLENIAITGQGAINGSGQVWRPLKKEKVTEAYWKNVIASGGALKNPKYWLPSQKAVEAELMSPDQRNALTEAEWEDFKDVLRPVMVSFVECKNIFLQGVLFENSPSWNIHPLMCENIVIDDVFIRNPSFAQNGDGLDLESCKNVLVVNSTLDVGDDAICIKSGRNEEGRRRGIPTENVIVDNCLVFKGHGGFVVGSEMSGGVKNIAVSNCNFIGTDVGLRFKSTRGRGGVVENIYIRNISMIDMVTEALRFNLFYGGKSASEALADGDAAPAEEVIPLVSEETPVFRNIFIRDVYSHNSRRAMLFNGLPEMNIENIQIENAVFTSQIGAELTESTQIKFKNVGIYPREGPALILYNVKNLEAENIQIPEGMKNPVRISGQRNQDIKLPDNLD